MSNVPLARSTRTAVAVASSMVKRSRRTRISGWTDTSSAERSVSSYWPFVGSMQPNKNVVDGAAPDWTWNKRRTDQLKAQRSGRLFFGHWVVVQEERSAIVAYWVYETFCPWMPDAVQGLPERNCCYKPSVADALDLDVRPPICICARGQRPASKAEVQRRGDLGAQVSFCSRTKYVVRASFRRAQTPYIGGMA